MNLADNHDESNARSEEIAVSVRDVDMRYGKTYAVKDASFDLHKGKFLTILGPSGSGKTTLLRLIAGFGAPSRGEIFINNLPVKAVPAHKRAIGMVFQRLALFPHMTAAQNVAFPLKMRRYDMRTIAHRVEHYLELVRLGGYGARRIDELSGGQQQRVAIARALVFEPDLLLLDEPLAALDVKLRQEMQLEFRRIQRELGVTTINVTHDQREALVVSDEVIVMNEGIIQQNAKPIAAYRAPNNAFVANFIGVTNFLTCQILAQEEETITLLCGTQKLKTTQGAAIVNALKNHPNCLAAIRAEQIRIAAQADNLAALHMCFFAEVLDSIFEGERIVYEVRLPDLEGKMLRVFDHDPLAHNQFSIGDKAYVGWNNNDMQIFSNILDEKQKEKL